MYKNLPGPYGAIREQKLLVASEFMLQGAPVDFEDIFPWLHHPAMEIPNLTVLF